MLYIHTNFMSGVPYINQFESLNQQFWPLNVCGTVRLARKSKCYVILILPSNIYWHFVVSGYLLSVHFVNILTKEMQQKEDENIVAEYYGTKLEII